MQSVFALLTSSKSEKFYYGNICVAQWSVIVRVISLFGQHDIVLANSKLLSQYKCHGEASGITTSSGDTPPLPLLAGCNIWLNFLDDQNNFRCHNTQDTWQC